MQTCERNRNQKLFWRIYYANGVLKFKRVGLSETNLGMKSKIKKMSSIKKKDISTYKESNPCKMCRKQCVCCE